MNPNRAENHSNTEIVGAPETGELSPDNTVESPAAAESSPGKQAPQPSTAAQPVIDPASLAQASSAIAITDDEHTSQGDLVGPAAAEGDRIEKEWVSRAKTIVAKTQDDPHAQKDAVSKVKAEYIQKRFNKVISTDDTVSA